MGMRKDWQTAKGAAELLFKKGTADAMLNALAKNKEPPSYPLKFKEDLGPHLDKYESAKKPEDKKKYADIAKKAIASYRNQINDCEKELKSASPQILTVLRGELNDIEKKLV